MVRRGYGKKTRYRPHWLVKLAGAMAAVGAVTYYINGAVRPALLSVMEYQCHSMAVTAVQDTVLKSLEEEPELFESLYRYQYDKEGAVLAINANTVAINKMKLTLSQAVEENLEGNGALVSKVPLGTLLGFSLLAEAGPEISIQILQDCYVTADVSTQMETTGVNQTQFMVLADFMVTMSAAVGGDTMPITTHHSVPVVQMLIMGKVPQYYASNG